MKSILIWWNAWKYFRITLILMVYAFIGLSFASTSTSSASTCMTTENDASSKWCTFINIRSSGYVCTSDESTTEWGGSSSYRWSSDSTNLPQNSKNLLCPTDSSNCNTQSNYFQSIGSSVTLASNTFDTNTIWWYYFYPYSPYINTITITINSLTSATAEVYTNLHKNHIKWYFSLFKVELFLVRVFIRGSRIFVFVFLY